MFPSGVFISPFHLPFRWVALAAVKPANITIALKAITKVLIFGKLLSAGRSTHPGFPVRPAVIEYIASARATVGHLCSTRLEAAQASSDRSTFGAGWFR